MEYKHIPVMLKEAIEYLNPKTGKYFIDCTLGGGGYTTALAKKIGSEGKVLTIDLDQLAINNINLKIQKLKLKNIKIAYGNFKNLQNIVKNNFKKKVEFDGVVFDLGLSSAQLEDKGRGFSFQLDAPLNMAFGAESEEETENIINSYKEEELTQILKEYGEERFARRIAKKIIEKRKIAVIKTTGELVKIIESAVPAVYKHNNRKGHRSSGARKIHFATRTFQALRIATNKELENIKVALPQALNLLKKDGRLVIISYHSLEDRIIKKFFKKESKECLCPPEMPTCECGHKVQLKILTRKVLLPSPEEIANNPRARSAKMRVAERIYD